MIEILDIKKYRYYGCQKSAFLFFFFKQENGQVLNKDNLALIKKIQSLEVEYKDLPLIAFNYDDFINERRNEINSFLDILVKHNRGDRILYEKVEPKQIPDILDSVRSLRLNIKMEANMQYQSIRYSMGTWTIKSHVRKLNPLLKCDKFRIKIQNELMGINCDKNKQSENLFGSNMPLVEILKSNVENDKWRKEPLYRKNSKKKSAKNLIINHKKDTKLKSRSLNVTNFLKTKQKEINILTKNIIDNSMIIKPSPYIQFGELKMVKLKFNKLINFNEYRHLEHNSKMPKKIVKNAMIYPYPKLKKSQLYKNIDIKQIQNADKSTSKLSNYKIINENNLIENNLKYLPNFSKTPMYKDYLKCEFPKYNKDNNLEDMVWHDSQNRKIRTTSPDLMDLEIFLQKLEKDY